MTWPEPDYLQPYADAARQYGGEFESLLWASPMTQAARFHAICRLVRFADRSVLDVGCGRADFFDHLVAIDQKPEHYTGIEAVPELARFAAAKKQPDYLILKADFIAEPARLFTGAEVIVVSGSLNTLSDKLFFDVLERLAKTGAEQLVFNFLDSPNLAGKDYLYWRDAKAVGKFCQRFGTVRMLEDYLAGDCTLGVNLKSKIDFLGISQSKR